jgi:hypothetical protein
MNRPSTSSLSKHQKLTVAVIAMAVLLVSAALAALDKRDSAAMWFTATEREAARLTATFGILIETSGGPLQSLATLFNGSGRVAAEEFTATVNALRARSSSLFPNAMAFMTEAKPSGCDSDQGCWLVAYSTVEDGLLKPGANMSRFAPTSGTIATALAEPNVMKLGPVISEADGSQFSFLAVTIKNTRQFGVIVSDVQYTRVMDLLSKKWMAPGVSARIEAAFPTSDGMTPFVTIHGEPNAPTGTQATQTQELTLNQAVFRLHWDFSKDYMGGQDRGALRQLLAGLLASILAATLAGWLLKRSNDQQSLASGAA